MTHYPTLDAWMHDTPANVVRMPIFPYETPARIVAEACIKFDRIALLSQRTGMIWLAKERTV